VVANGKREKRGFFSWLGFGQKEQAQETETEQKVEEQQAVAEETPAAETPAEPSAPKADPEAFAEEVVEVTETVVESEKRTSRSLPARRKKSGWKRLL
jgi:fused signal recognition particle receptor